MQDWLIYLFWDMKMAALLSKPRLLPKYQNPFYLSKRKLLVQFNIWPNFQTKILLYFWVPTKILFVIETKKWYIVMISPQIHTPLGSQYIAVINEKKTWPYYFCTVVFFLIIVQGSNFGTASKPTFLIFFEK